MTSLRFMWVLLLFAAPVAAQQRAQPQPLGNDVVGPWVWGYTPMREPRFVPAAQATFMKPETRIMGVSENGISKAYQDFVVHEHHFVQDKLGKMPILVTW